MRFFDRFRTALGRYAPGVHEVGRPAGEASLEAAERALGRLPGEYRDFLAQWNGAFLFHDDYVLFGVEGAHPELARLARAPAGAARRLALGAGPDRSLFLDERGRVVARDDQTEEEAVEGSGFERWLDATMAREAVLYDRDGEFREEAFDGGELSGAARRKRAQAALRIDDEAPAWHVELAGLLLEGGEPEEAIVALERALALEPGDAASGLLLGRLLREAGRHDRAAAAFARAAEAEADPGEAAFAWASAARAVLEAGGGLAEPARAAHAARVLALEADFAARQRAAADHLQEEGDLDGAADRLALAAAVAPDDAEVRAAAARLRARRSLAARSD